MVASPPGVRATSACRLEVVVLSMIYVAIGPLTPPRAQAIRFLGGRMCMLMFTGHPGGWRNGRRAGFRCQCPSGRGGSSPPPPTTLTAADSFAAVSSHLKGLSALPLRPSSGEKHTRATFFGHRAQRGRVAGVVETTPMSLNCLSRNHYSGMRKASTGEFSTFRGADAVAIGFERGREARAEPAETPGREP